MILTSDLKARVEKEVGTEICPAFFTKAERYARQKLNRINERASRKYGEDGYGDEYLVLLTADTVRELAFSEYTFNRSAEIMAARALQKGGESA
ncbi:hypothetical protein [Gudongella oleilytica]|uniref:hypothetical protein n=1 Tax=Gudongella oleilytica TaxID=1582259 RepID=UPI002A35C45D|nr:hypothetical protein [Gudongella oleilytica]MDY0256234.1 hypothetical protein [Gudongella oleilytica]